MVDCQFATTVDVESIGDSPGVVKGGFQCDGAAEFFAFYEFHHNGAIFNAIDGGEGVSFSGEAD